MSQVISHPAPIAIIGVGCRLPGGANNLEKLWELLSEGRNGQTEIPKDRWNADSWFDPYPDAKQSMVTRHGYFLQDDISQFDAKFFGISSAEANSMDPQQRLFLMTTYEALDDAGIPVETLRGSNTGVYASIFERSYDRMGHKDLSTIGRTHLNGTGESILSNRISYCFDLRGPCMTIDTGCSGSLVGLHQACQSLRLGESTLALVGGSQLVIQPDVLSIMSGMGMLNPDGKSYAFDSRGAGYGRGEGVATIVLKCLDDALKDGDRVHAIIANSGMNQDGKTPGLNTPSSEAQAALSLRVYQEAGLNPADTSFVEAHGTGTQAGDREEIASISKVFCEGSDRGDDLYVGSVKTNIGHLEATSGIAGLLKSILVFKHGQIPANLNFIKPKPSIKLYEKKIKARFKHNLKGNTNGTSTVQNGYQSCNGAANGHSTTQLASLNKSSAPTDGTTPQLIVFSASTEKSLLSTIQNTKQWANTHLLSRQILRSLSYTLAVRKSALSFRRAIVASTPVELLEELDQITHPKRAASLAPLTFVFSGQGAQWHAMGRELINSSHCFRQSMMDMEDTIRQERGSWRLTEELLRSESESRIGDAEISQPATTAIQIALVDLLESFAIRPSHVIGHSSGEVAAAYAAGALSRDNAIIVAYHRGVASSMAKAAARVPGSMMAVSLGEGEAQRYIDRVTTGTISVACVNSTESSTISGDSAAIEELKSLLDAEGIFARKLKVDTAYHSHHMRRVAQDYHRAMRNVKSSDVQRGITFYSTVTGTTKSTSFDADYWSDNLVSQVKFSQALALLRDDQLRTEPGLDTGVFVEIGPHPALAGPSRQTVTSRGGVKFKVEYMSALERHKNAVQTVLSVAGKLFELGHKLDLEAVLKMAEAREPEVIWDLKSYPWDLAPFWHESRLSKAHRFRKFPPHDLLGLLDPACTVQEPRWRYLINLDALPWLRDHVVEGFTLYPGAGYLTMAIEAMKQLAQLRGAQQSISRFALRDVTISKSLVLDEPDNDEQSGEVEVQLSMSTSQQYEGSRWETFRICSYNSVNESWTDNCEGEITIEYEGGEEDEVNGPRESDLRMEESMQLLNAAQKSCDMKMTKAEFYEFAKLTGNQWDGAFSPIDSLKYGNKQGLLDIIIPDVAALMPYRSFRPHLIHPITLDAVHQLSGMLFKKFVSNAPCVPTKITLLEIDANISTRPGNSLTAAMQIEPDGPKASTGQSWVFQENSDGQLRPVIRLLVNLRAIGEAHQDENRPFVHDKVNRLEWNLDADSMTETSFSYFLSVTLGLDDNMTYNYQGSKVSAVEAEESSRVADQAASIWIRDALAYVEANNVEITSPHLVKYLGWMKKWISSDYHGQIMSGLCFEDEATILQRIDSLTDAPELQLLARVGRALPEILSGTSDPLSVMLEGNLLIRAYEGGTFSGDYEAAVAYLQLLTFKNPRLRFLEIGAGTGGCTKRILGGISGRNIDGGLPIEQYTYTDISSGFFEEARTTFANWESYIDFKTLDVEGEPLTQGFEPESYDVIVASNVLHATKRMDVTMQHVRKILRPGGSLVLVENSPKGAVIGLIFGTLSGWWAHEDEFREDTALMYREQWDTILSRNGFGGVHVACNSMMVSKAVAPLANGHTNGHVLGDHRITLIEDAADDRVVEISKHIKSPATDVQISQCTWDRVDVSGDAVYLVVDLAETPLLLDPQPQLFTTLNALLASKAKILWVVIQDTPDPVSTAYKGVVSAFVRVLRRESGNTEFVTVDVREPAPSPEVLGKAVAGVLQKCFWPVNSDEKFVEPEMAYENGQLLIPRVLPDTTFLKWARSGWNESTTRQTETALHQSGRALKLEVASPGLLNSLRFVDGDLLPQLGADQIEVKPGVYGVNYRDVCVALGQMKPNTPMVGEFAGVVTAVGPDMTESFQVGDRVMGFGAQPYSNISRLNGHHAHKTPSWMSESTAASIPYAYVTAYQCLRNLANLEKRQTVLIHSASGAVGQAAIQLAQSIGAEIFCTVGNCEKQKFLTDNYSIPRSHIFSSRSGSLKQSIMHLTGEQGVDLVLSTSTGEMLRESLDCVKSLGVFIDLVKTERQKACLLSMAAFEKSITFHAFDLTTLAERKPQQISRVLGEVTKLIGSGALIPREPATVYSIEQVEDAFRVMSARKHIGKVVLVTQPTSRVKCLPAQPTPLRLRKDGTYIVAGGLGDLPSRICHFFAARGAGHIVSLSRRTIDDETRRKHVTAVEAHGGQLHLLKCDITNEEQMTNVASFCRTLPPVRGVVQGALALRDRTFSQMTVDEWNKPLQPKIVGTINLDKYFASSDLAFFVTLSSIVSVIGKSGQSNYAAGNGFQDAFARAHANHPRTQYASLNIGAVSIDAHGALEASQNETSISTIRASLRQNSVMDISFDEFFANFEYLMTDVARKDDLHQSIQGVTRLSMVEANDEYLLDNPVFNQLQHTLEKKTSYAAKSDKADFTKALAGVKTMVEAEQLIQDAALAKFAVFLDRPIEEIRVDQSLATIGLDSLVSIELKNWMVRTFQVNLQTSELSGAGSIIALTSTVALRSKLIPDEIRQLGLKEIGTDAKESSSSTNNKAQADHGFYCCRTCRDLPRYPLVDLDEAVKDLLNGVGHFAHTREEYTELSRKAHELTAPDSLGRRLYNKLRARADDPNVESWIADLLLKALHLKRRYPLAPYGNFLGTHFDSPTVHTQAERAAILTTALCEFKADRDAGRLEPDFLGTRANCGHSLSWLFNAVREPNVGCDKMMKYSGNEYVAVLRKGHLFKVPLKQEATTVSYDMLKATYQAILDLDVQDRSWAGMLTTDNRDSWGLNRQKLLSLDSGNGVYLETIEASVFVLCLDDNSPITRAERVRSGYMGDSFNRWHDKCTQIIVTANGRSATIFEHSMIDLMTVFQLSQRLQSAINTLDPNNATGSHDAISVDVASLNEIPLVTTQDINSRIETLRQDYLAITSTKQYVPHLINSFGKTLFLSHSAPIKATVDLTIQLASRLYFGYLPASWETVSTAHFHLGRPEIVQVVLKSVMDFCDAALDDAVPRSKARTKLLQAARECNAQIAKGTEGRNYFRLMDVIEVMAQDQPDEEMPKLFSDPVWKRGYPQLIMQTMVETKLAEDPGFTMPHPESVWMNYTVFDNSVEVCFVSPVKGAERFGAALDRAANLGKEERIALALLVDGRRSNVLENIQPVEAFSPQEIQSQISGIHDRMDALEAKMDQILETLSHLNPNATCPGLSSVSTVGASGQDTIQTQYVTPAQEGRVSELSTSEDQELLRAGQLYQTWCHNQPIYLFHQEEFLNTLKYRDEELRLALKMLTYRFPPGHITPDKQEALKEFSTSCRKLVTDRIYKGKIRLSTLQTLCLLSMISFSVKVARELTHGTPEGYVMQAGLDLDMAHYFASGLPLGSSLGDSFEYSLCIQNISLLQSLQGSIPDIAEPANIQGLFQSANHLLELINHRAEKFPLPREPSAEVESNDGRGILAYMSQAAKVWHLARAYAAMRVGSESPPPWSTQSDYALVNLRNLELDCRFPLVYRFATNHFGELPPEVLQQRRDYWGPWIFIQFIHAAIPTLLNHPFLLSLRLKNYRHMIPQTFMYQSFDLISKHTAWIICYLDLVEKQQFEISDPTIAHAVVIVATIHLQHSFVEDSVLCTRAERGYNKCMRFLDHMGCTWPVVLTMASLQGLRKKAIANNEKTQKLRKLQDSITTVPASSDQRGTRRSWSIDVQLLWELLVYEKAGRDTNSSDKSMYDDIITLDAEHGGQDVGGDFAIVGSAGISGHKGALREISAYAPQDKDPYETLGNLATPSRDRSIMQESNIFGDRNCDNLPDLGLVDQDNFLLQAEDFGRAVNDWMSLDIIDAL
ncbi:polyketide synthase [Fusarium pseudocircinatum]|uniref:Polyketide synthase n=1 Tax=Fusarium pseudocircinatum TaxID=56676 RepID=A0A8H5KQM3_9HYPO|nr:polyketide synthase [Fusarium pseudocircinatum]